LDRRATVSSAWGEGGSAGRLGAKTWVLEARRRFLVELGEIAFLFENGDLGMGVGVGRDDGGG
jgi:hypothetical protein